MSTPGTSLPYRASSWPVAGELGLGAISLVLANAGILTITFVYDVTLIQLVLVYWCECVWIGVFSAIKLIAASIFGEPYENRWAHVSRGSAFLTSVIVIFFASSGFFMLLGATLIAILFAEDGLPAAANSDVHNLGLVFGASVLLLVGHGLSFVVHFLLLGEFRHARVVTLIALPFKRCLALLLAIAASFAVILTLPQVANATAFALLVIFLKVFGDLRLHVSERRAFARSSVEREVTQC